jgi:hypothetical protein
MLCRASDFDGFFGTTETTENGHEIWHIECKESLWGRFVDRVTREVAKYKLVLVGV